MNNESVLQHTTLAGQRWDQIALEKYGRADMMNKIIAANPDVPIYDLFPAGVILNIPIIDKIEVKTDVELLPPWKR